VRTTKILPLVLVCVVAFAAASTLGLVLWSSVIQTDAAVVEGTFDIHRFAETIAQNVHVKGDPINDPKPNAH